MAFAFSMTSHTEPSQPARSRLEKYRAGADHSLSETLVPPFFQVTLDPTIDEDDPMVCAVMEEMISLAPSRDGFLGLETKRDASGHRSTVAYWRSTDNIENWKRAAVRELRRRFRGLNLERTCGFHVQRIQKSLFSGLWSRAQKPWQRSTACVLMSATAGAGVITGTELLITAVTYFHGA